MSILKELNTKFIYKCNWFDGLSDYIPFGVILTGMPVVMFESKYYCTYEKGMFDESNIPILKDALDNVRSNSKEN